MPKLHLPAIRQTLTAPTNAAPPTALFLMWYYPPASNIVFEVFHSYSLVPLDQFQMLAVTADCSLPLQATSPHELFIVRARDLSTGLVSDWATR